MQPRTATHILQQSVAFGRTRHSEHGSFRELLLDSNTIIVLSFLNSIEEMCKVMKKSRRSIREVFIRKSGRRCSSLRLSRRFGGPDTREINSKIDGFWAVMSRLTILLNSREESCEMKKGTTMRTF